MSATITEIGAHVARIVSLVKVLGDSDRAVSAWMNKNLMRLAERGFSNRPAVAQRQSYIEMGREAKLEGVLGGGAVHLWISGSGGSGKSSLGFESGRRVLSSMRFLPVVVDFAWKGSLNDYIASVLDDRTSGSAISGNFVKQLLRSGYLGIIVDGLSEIQRPGAAEEILAWVRNGDIRHAIVTSRQGCPDPELFTEIQLGNLDDVQLDKMIAALVPQDKVQQVSSDLRRFSAGKGLSPLFARLAIDYQAKHGNPPQDYADIIQNYLLSLRSKTSTSPSEGDFLRACRLTALACLDGTYAPHDVSEDYLRGVLDAESNRSPFYDMAGSKISAYALIAELRACGVVQTRITNATSRVDFVHHPVAEYLAASQRLAFAG